MVKLLCIEYKGITVILLLDFFFSLSLKTDYTVVAMTSAFGGDKRGLFLLLCFTFLLSCFPP